MINKIGFTSVFQGADLTNCLLKTLIITFLDYYTK